MADAPISIAVHGVIDHARAETLAARIRAAVRNGKREIALVLDADAVIASQAFLAFIIRAAAVLRQDRGRLALTGDPTALEQLQALAIPAAINGGASSTPGDGV